MNTTQVRIANGYIYIGTGDTMREAGTDLTFGVPNRQGARYRCNCGRHYDLPRDIAAHLTSGNCNAL